MKTTRVLFGVFLLAAAYALSQQSQSSNRAPSAVKTETSGNIMTNKVTKSDAEWKQELTPEQYHVLREKGTERAFTGEYWDKHEPGVYHCAACGAVVFASEAKFDSGCGWPSFDRAVGTNAVATRDDSSFGMHRTEVYCPHCGGHLGHVFDDGPRETTGLRYCINSVSLKFEPGTNASAKKE